MEAMTSEREAFEAAVRQWPNYSERTLARDGRYPEYYGSPVVQGAWEGWKARAHLAQPAQAVDVGAIRSQLLRIAADNQQSALTLGQEGLRGQCIETAKELHKLTRALSGEKAGPVGDGPDVALLASMATCLHHGFGLLDATQQQSLLHDMRKLWDEVMGRGYYRPENRDRYLAYLASPTPGKEGE